MKSTRYFLKKYLQITNIFFTFVALFIINIIVMKCAQTNIALLIIINSKKLDINDKFLTHTHTHTHTHTLPRA
jgi:hypothetical protein